MNISSGLLYSPIFLGSELVIFLALVLEDLEVLEVLLFSQDIVIESLLTLKVFLLVVLNLLGRLLNVTSDSLESSNDVILQDFFFFLALAPLVGGADLLKVLLLFPKQHLSLLNCVK